MGALVSLTRVRAVRGLPPEAPRWVWHEIWRAPNGLQGARVRLADTGRFGLVVGWHRRLLLLAVRLDDGRTRFTAYPNLVVLPQEGTA